MDNKNNIFYIKKRIRKKRKFKIKNKVQKQTKNKVNLGVELLRMILSFLIVLVHNLDAYYAYYKLNNFPQKHLAYYVPTFFFISFYFSYNTLTSRNIEKIKERFIRILVPYLGWPIIFWLRDYYLYYRYGIKGNILLRNMYIQIIIGCRIHGVFWFLFNILFLNNVFVIIIFLFKKKYFYVLFIITLLFYIFSHSIYGKQFFNLFNFNPIGHSISPIPKMILYSFTGFFCASKNLIKHLYNYRCIILILCGLLLFIILHYNVFVKVPSFFSGIMIDLFIINTFSFFSMIPFDKIKNTFIFSILKQITSHTGGVYYLHTKCYEILRRYIKPISRRSFQGCLLSYLYCYLLCVICSFLFRKSKIKHLFY